MESSKKSVGALTFIKILVSLVYDLEMVYDLKIFQELQEPSVFMSQKYDTT